MIGRLGVPKPDIADVCQEVFLIVHRRLDDYDEDRGGLRAWIYGICVRAAADYRKRAYRRNERVGMPVLELIASPEQHRELELRRARARLQAVLLTLDEGKREVFVLYELEELPMAEVAKIVDCPLQTAYSRLHAARKAVAAAFDEQRASGDSS